MKRIFIIVILLISASASFAQTKRIEHRSHSGSDKTFTTKGSSNFGLPPTNSPERKRMDSLRKVNMRKDSIDKAKKVDSLKRANSKKKNVTKKKG